jgi:hypothetical protein
MILRLSSKVVERNARLYAISFFYITLSWRAESISRLTRLSLSISGSSSSRRRLLMDYYSYTRITLLPHNVSMFVSSPSSTKVARHNHLRISPKNLFKGVFGILLCWATWRRVGVQDNGLPGPSFIRPMLTLIAWALSRGLSPSHRPANNYIIRITSEL